MIHSGGGLGGAVQERLMRDPPSFRASCAWSGNAWAGEVRTPIERRTSQAATFTQRCSSWFTSGRTSTRTVGPDCFDVKPLRGSGLDHLNVGAGEEGPPGGPEIHLQHSNLGLRLERHELGRERRDLPDPSKERLPDDAHQIPGLETAPGRGAVASAAIAAS